jgi:beta-carotene hydroxylase
MNGTALRAEERRIAEQFMGRTPWIMVIWGLGGTLAWLALWPLVLGGHLSLWIAAPIATVIVCYSYLPAHDALHHIIGRPGTRLHWLNEVVAEASLIMIVFPRRPARLTHFEHHRHTNHAERDPDYATRAPNIWAAIWQSIAGRHPKTSRKMEAYRTLLSAMPTKDAKYALLDLLISRIAFFTILAVLAWSGYAIEAALLWWLPRHVAITYIEVVLSWAPHHPAVETGRYRTTRAFTSPVGTLLTGALQYHIVHHLYPTIPLHKTPAAFRAMRHLLEKQGCALGGL